MIQKCIFEIKTFYESHNPSEKKQKLWNSFSYQRTLVGSKIAGNWLILGSVDCFGSDSLKLLNSNRAFLSVKVSTMRSLFESDHSNNWDENSCKGSSVIKRQSQEHRS